MFQWRKLYNFGSHVTPIDNKGQMTTVSLASLPQRHLKNESHPSTVSRRYMILNSYMRSGSSFVGELVGLRPDTFYWFELLWGFSRWGFMNGSELCDSRNCSSCGKSPFPSTIDTVLEDFFSCNFSQLTKVLARDTPRMSGPLWSYPECNKRGNMQREKCLARVQKHCSSKTHLAAKVLRTSLDNYETFLNKHESVVLIQLFRDPRAVVNSRSKTRWYKYRTDKALEYDANCLCSRMLVDYTYGKKFQAKYPDRMLFVIYEDLLSDIRTKLDRLYDKLGISTLDKLKSTSGEFQEVLSKIGKSYSSKPNKPKSRNDYEFWWRTNLSWHQIQIIDKYCEDIYRVIGYRAFQDRKEVTDMNVTSLNVRDILKL